MNSSSVALFLSSAFAIAVLSSDATAQSPPRPVNLNDRDTHRQTSDWGQVENSLHMRVLAPQEIEQGVSLRLKLEFRQDKPKPGIKRLNTFLPDEYIELLLTDPQQEQTWTVKPHDPTMGMPPPPDMNRFSVPLDGSEVEPWDVGIPLVTLYKALKPGTYTARVRFKFPEQSTQFWQGTKDEWREAGFWHGTLVSAPFPLKLIQEVPKTETFAIPRRLRFRTDQIRLREDDPQDTAIPAVYFEKGDVEKVDVPVRNGHYFGTWIYRDGEPSQLSGGALSPDKQNTIDVWYDYKGGDRKATYTIEVFETPDPPQHGWMPGSGSKGYKTLWKKTYRVTYSRNAL